MSSTIEISQGLVRARRTAATARATMAVAGVAAAVVGHSGGLSPMWSVTGFEIIFATSLVQLLLPRPGWSMLEESLAPVSAALIIGLGPERVTTVSLLWLSTVACGVLARGGRQHWIGRAVLLVSLTLPIVLHQRLSLGYGLLCLAAVALLLTCGRTTQELRAMHDRARYDADHDGLTGVLSRTAFRAALDRVAGAPAAPPDDETDSVAPVPETTALLLVDLDNFGAINKSSGHAAGDRVLTALAERVRAAVGEAGLVGRLGGDEFVAVLHDADPAARARRLLDELATETAGFPALRASAGMALVPRDGDDAEALLRAVDVALRVAKRSGGRQLSVYAGESFSDRGPSGVRETLERLIAGQGLSVVVQPIVSVPDGLPHAFEALARFQTRGTSSPLHWFALADEFGVRDRLELACLQAALQIFAARPPGTRLSVNLSGPLLLGRGIRFAVDDMGAGYSGLRQITTVRPSYLKLDRSLVTGIDTDPDRGALVSAMVGYAHQTGGHLVTEGVETAAELDTLLSLGVRLVQGYYLARPGWPWPEVDLPHARPGTPLPESVL